MVGFEIFKNITGRTVYQKIVNLLYFVKNLVFLGMVTWVYPYFRSMHGPPSGFWGMETVRNVLNLHNLWFFAVLDSFQP